MSIRNLEEVIAAYLKKKGSEFISYETTNLLPVGENYGSTMLAVDIKVKNRAGEEETIRCVGKSLPPGKSVQEFFNVVVTFKKEIQYYNTIVPAVEEFCFTRGVDDLMDFSAKCIGARISLKPSSDVVDDDAVLLLENLKSQGYICGDRFEGVDFETAKLLLRNLATIQASVIAFKLAKPEEFKQKIEANLGIAIVFVASDEMLDDLVKHVQVYASRNPACLPLLTRIEEGVRKLKEFFVYSEFREPFATLIHNDLWTNNFMIKYVGGKSTNTVLVDFQVMRYGSPARDVLFFLYSSVHLEIIKTKIDELIRFYYDCLIDTLKRLKCNVDLFTYDLFMDEVDRAARETEFCHLIMMLTPIFTVKGKAKDLTEWKPENLAPESEEMLHKNYFERLHFIVMDFARRNWI